MTATRIGNLELWTWGRSRQVELSGRPGRWTVRHSIRLSAGVQECYRETTASRKQAEKWAAKEIKLAERAEA